MNRAEPSPALTRGNDLPRLLRRNVSQPDHILTDAVGHHEAERRARAGEEWFAAAKHHGLEIKLILVNEVGQACRQLRSGNFDHSIERSFQAAYCRLQVVLDERGIGADRRQRAGDDPFRLVPPGGGVVAFRSG